jgi:S1-C subfamily serine protease
MRPSLFLALALAALPAAAADKPTRVEIGKKAKAATAYVEHAHGTGTAFCVHPSGLFVTNEHVVRTADNGSVTLVLNPSLEGQRVLKAKVVRTDKAVDLALLRVDGVKDLPALTLGSTKDLSELAEVVACGFPLGKALSADKKEYPAVSVNAGSVTALRHKDKQLDIIQIDVSLTYGNSGGPVVDDTGGVVGVVVRGLAGGRVGINEAIPVGHLDRFLTAPDLAFVPPALARADAGKPTEFTARVVSFVPNAPEPALKLIVQAGDEEPREVAMRKAGEAFTATVTPVVKPAVSLVELTARFGSASVTGTTADLVFTVDGKPVRLSGVRGVEFGPKPTVQLADGRTTLSGEVAGLGKVEVNVGGQKAAFDLSKASKLAAQPVPEVAAVRLTVVASVDGKEVARVDERVAIRDANVLRPADPSAVTIAAPPLAEDKVVKKLPEVFTDVVVGGGGRYLVFHMPKLKQLAVFDFNELRVTKYIPLAEEDVTFTAGLECVVIGLKRAGKLERWSLTTFELEKSGPPPFQENLKVVLMGHGSNGPLVANGYFLDLATFKQLPLVNKDKNAQVWGSEGRLYPSGDGTVFSSWNTHLSPSSNTTFVIEGEVVRRYEDGDLMHSIPGPDGRTVYTGKGIVSRILTRGDADDKNYGYCLPAVRGDYFLSLTSATGRNKGEGGGGFTVHLRGLRQPVAKLEKANHGLGFDGWDREPFGPWKRVFFVPDAKVIAVLPASNDQVVLHKIDPDAELEKSGQEYLLVTSQPPSDAKAGATLTYAVQVKAKDKKISYALDSGPKGMTVSAEGVVTWAVPADAPAGEQAVILTARDGKGQEVFHTFTLRVASR